MRIVGALAVAMMAGMAIAQAPFTIVRPLEGSKVREKVKILVPKNSVPPGGFVAVYLNDQFIEAISPTPEGKYYEYLLDTKARGLADGKAKLELVLFQDYNDQPKMVDKTSVHVTIANKASIPIPKKGLLLRYRYAPGTQTEYDVAESFSQSTLSDAQRRKGGRANSLSVDALHYRVLFAVDNVYPNGDGLIRSQVLLPQGKKSMFVRTVQEPQGRTFTEEELAQFYQRLTPTGNEVFGSVPLTFPIEGMTSHPENNTNYYSFDVLPSLPARSVRVGDSWASRFQIPEVDMARIYELTSIVKPFPARGDFVGVEWELGHPCAKIHQEIAAGKAGVGRESISQDIWFALDRGVVLKMIESQTIDQTIAAQTQPSPTGGGAPVNPGGGRSGGGKGRGRGGGGGPGSDSGGIDVQGPGDGQAGLQGSSYGSYGPQGASQAPTYRPSGVNGDTFLRISIYRVYTLRS